MSGAFQSVGHKAPHQKSEPQKCFVAHSYQAEWHDTIEAVCNELLPEYGLQPWYAEYNYDPTTTLRDKVVSMIDSAPYGIYDLSYWRLNERSPWVTPCNVFIELGIAIALNRPTILLRHTGNRIAKIELPRSIQSVTQICEFTGGDYSLEKALREHLSRQANSPTDCDWQHHHCRFGEIDCSYIPVYPHTAMIGHDKLHCHIADGPDTDQIDFRRTIEAVLGKFNNISYSYLDKRNIPGGYTFLLCAHCQLIRSTPFAIYRITPDTSPDIYIAIGISIGLEYRFHYKIPRFLITKDMQYVPSLLQGYQFVLMKNLHALKTTLPQFVQQILTKIDEPAYWRPQELPFETRVLLGSEPVYDDITEEKQQKAKRKRRALVREARNDPGLEVLTSEDGYIHMDGPRRLVHADNQEVWLTLTEFELLYQLMLHSGKVLTHRALLRRVWGPEYGEETGYLRTYVRQLRLKLEPEPSQPKYIFTEAGIGYVFRSKNTLESVSAPA